MVETRKKDEADTLRPIDQGVRDQIAAGMRREFSIDLNVPASEWDLLEAILRGIYQSFNDWQGYLNKTEMAKIRGIASKAAKLASAMAHAEQSGLGKIIDFELSPFTSDQILAALTVLSKITPRGPKADDALKPHGMRFEDNLKAELQLKLDAWWVRNTGSPAETERSKVTPFSYFLAQIFKTLPTEIARELGTSRTAVKDRRRAAAQRQKRDREIAEKFQKLSSLKNRNS